MELVVTYALNPRWTRQQEEWEHEAARLKMGKLLIEQLCDGSTAVVRYRGVERQDARLGIITCVLRVTVGPA